MTTRGALIRAFVGRTWIWAALTLLVSLSATGWAWSMAHDREITALRLRFQRQVIRAASAVDDQLANCEAMAKGARGLVAASKTVDASEWAAYLDSLDLPRHAPAVAGIGFVQLVPESELEAFLARAAADDPGFSVPPPRPDRVPPPAVATDARIMRFMGPSDANRVVLGLDVRTRPNVVEAMDRARDTGAVAMTAVMQLAQDPLPQPSVVIYLPIYRSNADLSSVGARRLAIVGWISAPVRLRHLALDVLGHHLGAGIDFELIERRGSDAPAIIFDADGVSRADDASPLSEVTDVQFGGRHWSLRFTGLPDFSVGESPALARFTLASGVALSVLLSGMILALSRTGSIARRLALHMTASLRESEARYEAAVSATRQLFYDWDPETDIITVRGCARETLGLELPSRSTLAAWRSLVHPDDLESFNHEVARVLRTKAPFNLEYRIRRIDGGYAVIHDSGCFFCDAAGDISRMVGFAIDITERRRAEEERRQSDERFRVLFERSGVPFLLLSDGRVIDCNDAAVRMLGASGRPAVIGMRPHDFSPEVQPDGQASHARLDALLAEVDEKGAATFEWTCRRVNGEAFVVEAIHACVTFGGARLVLVGWHDLTRLRLAEQERRRLQRVLQIAVDAMPQRVFWKDRSGTFLGCNRAFARDAGVAHAEDVVGKTDFDLAWRAHAHARRADDFEVMAAGRPRVNAEELTTVAGGAERWLRSTRIPLYDELGRTIGILGTFEDITDERLSKEELRRARDTAEAASRAKSEFLANMSHEIRTPMTAILGYADLLAEPAQDAIHRVECIRTIRSNGEHLLTIVNDILDLSKIEAGKMSIERVPVNAAAIVRDTIALIRPRAECKNLRIEASFGTLVPRVIISDPTRLRQMLVNLIGNAVKFTEEGLVQVHFQYEPPVGEGPASVRFDVIDTGIGMSADVLATLFQPFTQADSSVTRRFGGTGLGLTVTRRLAGLLGGDVSVRSSPGKGSTFSIRIPIGASETPELVDARDDPPECIQPDTARAVSLCGRILLVEDGPDNQRLLAHLLRAAGAEVDIAPDGQVALNLLTPDNRGPAPFDIILMDMQMPVVDGYSATRTLRSRGIRLPVIALTAHAMSGERERCLAAGCDDYATKPVTRDLLLTLCARWITASRENAGGARLNAGAPALRENPDLLQRGPAPG